MSELVHNEWQHSILGCFSDMGICFRGCCCCMPLCMMCENAEKTGNSGLMWTLLVLCVPTVAVSLTRTATREIYGIEGEPVMDWVCGCCLPACTNCQIAMEHKARSENGYNARGPPRH
ncbi:cornifelin homolog [Eurytemora carolleeae]|uniref:cornifelin homolog n=1 Tax=Eurytemora carolleeae TaxID=1294199 RepID=UPI000C78E1BD|nr:cornifelin homolog [Eurytemora carolleeae]|eukprot:XP_023323093.1 cornifelin homolog [Eurytemora affinis]